jgi:hypothetical protein
LQTAADVAVFNLRGELVRTLHRGTLSPGPHRFEWNRLDQTGKKSAAGVYFVRVRATDATATTKLVLLD